MLKKRVPKQVRSVAYKIIDGIFFFFFFGKEDNFILKGYRRHGNCGNDTKKNYRFPSLCWIRSNNEIIKFTGDSQNVSRTRAGKLYLSTFLRRENPHMPTTACKSQDTIASTTVERCRYALRKMRRSWRFRKQKHCTGGKMSRGPEKTPSKPETQAFVA